MHLSLLNSVENKIPSYMLFPEMIMLILSIHPIFSTHEEEHFDRLFP